MKFRTLPHCLLVALLVFSFANFLTAQTEEEPKNWVGTNLYLGLGNLQALGTYQYASPGDGSDYSFQGETPQRNVQGGIGLYYRRAFNRFLFFQVSADYQRLDAQYSAVHSSYSGFNTQVSSSKDFDYRYQFGILDIAPMLRAEIGKNIRLFLSAGPNLSLITDGHEYRKGTECYQTFGWPAEGCWEVDEKNKIYDWQPILRARIETGVSFRINNGKLDAGVELLPKKIAIAGKSSAQMKRMGVFVGYGIGF